MNDKTDVWNLTNRIRLKPRPVWSQNTQSFHYPTFSPGEFKTPEDNPGEVNISVRMWEYMKRQEEKDCSKGSDYCKVESFYWFWHQLLEEAEF